MDKHWDEVMKLAKQYGFIIQAAGGTAILATHENQKQHYGEDEYKHIQKMNGKCVKDLGYPECEMGCKNCFLTAREKGHGYGVHYL
jgi:hypothetical protein